MVLLQTMLVPPSLPSLRAKLKTETELKTLTRSLPFSPDYPSLSHPLCHRPYSPRIPREEDSFDADTEAERELAGLAPNGERNGNGNGNDLSKVTSDEENVVGGGGGFGRSTVIGDGRGAGGGAGLVDGRPVGERR